MEDAPGRVWSAASLEFLSVATFPSAARTKCATPMAKPTTPIANTKRVSGTTPNVDQSVDPPPTAKPVHEKLKYEAQQRQRQVRSGLIPHQGHYELVLSQSSRALRSGRAERAQ